MILIAGVNGYIGRKLFSYCLDNKIPCVGIGRNIKNSSNVINCDILHIKKIKDQLKNISVIINCCGYAHDLNDSSPKYKNKVWSGNYDVTVLLLELGSELKINKFIQLSSIKAMSDPGDKCVNENHDLNPSSEYGKAKLAAENLCLKTMKNTMIKVVILRLTMVYGPHSKGNFNRMFKFISLNLFPPIPQTYNRRSLVHIHDVIDAIINVTFNQKADNNIFIITGPESPSGRDLFNLIRRELGYKEINMSIPRKILLIVAIVFEYIEKFLRIKIPFNQKILSQLLDSAHYSSNKIQNEIGWVPKVSLNKGLKNI